MMLLLLLQNTTKIESGKLFSPLNPLALFMRSNKGRNGRIQLGITGINCLHATLFLSLALCFYDDERSSERKFSSASFFSLFPSPFASFPSFLICSGKFYLCEANGDFSSFFFISFAHTYTHTH